MKQETIDHYLTEQAKLGLLEQLHAKGVKFHVELPYFGQDGTVLLSVQEIYEYIINPDVGLALHFGVSVERFRRWREFASNGNYPQCKAPNKNGQRCKNYDETLMPIETTPADSFDEAYCRVHKKTFSVTQPHPTPPV